MSRERDAQLSMAAVAHSGGKRSMETSVRLLVLVMALHFSPPSFTTAFSPTTPGIPTTPVLTIGAVLRFNPCISPIRAPALAIALVLYFTPSFSTAFIPTAQGMAVTQVPVLAIGLVLHFSPSVNAGYMTAPATQVDSIETSLFRACPTGLVSQLSRPTLWTMSKPSSLACIQACAQVDSCSGADVCLGAPSGRVECKLVGTDGGGNVGCDNLMTASSVLCRFLWKIQSTEETTTLAEETTQTTQPPTTTPLVCQNGGTPGDTKCQCPIQYSGRTCHRLIRDCSEPYENGYVDTQQNGVYMIKPISSPQQFPVFCVLSWGGVTLPLRWNFNGASFNHDWVTCKAGFNDFPDTTNMLNSKDYFVGLENLHHLLNQSVFELHIYTQHSGTEVASAFYTNFNVGPQVTSYAVTYDTSGGAVTNDGFSSHTPVVFSASGHDTNGCFSQRGTPGWYGSDCSGYTQFTQGSFPWPVNLVERLLTLMEFNLVRMEPYDDE